MTIQYLHTTYVRDGYAFEVYSEDFFGYLLILVSADDTVESIIEKVKSKTVGERHLPLCRAIYKIEMIHECKEG